jgi:two-component system chemotaxis sensor kinase CheA
MLEQIAQQADRVALALVSTDADDLQALAKVHEGLAVLEKLGQDATRDDIAHSAAGLAKAVEDIVLQQVADTADALKKVSAAVSELQRLVQPSTDMDLGGAIIFGKSPDQNTHSHPEPQPETERIAEPADHASHGDQIGEESVVPEADVQLVGDFISEANSHLDDSESALLAIENSPHDIDSVNAVFRAFHTIKGVAGFLNRRQIGALAHAAESLLDAARNRKLELTGTTLDVVLEALDMMRALIASLASSMKQGRAEPRHEGLVALIRRLEASVGSGTSGASKNASASPSSSGSANTPAPQSAPAVPVDLFPAAAPAEPTADAAGKQTADAALRANGGPDSEATVKVGTARLDSLVNMVGELLIAQAMVQQGAGEYSSRDQGLARSLRHMGKISRELQDLSMSMRMVPIQGVFQKMTRLARDVGRKAGKQVELVTIGGETELDRNVVEAVSDPLVHMVRNAVDHGIESPDDRLQLDKSPTGRVELRAFHHSGNIVIQISDDGKGLDRDRILRKAIQSGIVTPDQNLTDQEVYALIFHAGLSTAEKITDVSGRGVGMDVVRKNIEALRGRIEIATRPGNGSTFTIRLPITLAMIDGMVVRVGDARYIIPTTSIEQSLQARPEQLSGVQGGRAQMCMVRGSLLPVYRLATVFGLEEPPADGGAAGLTVILQDNERRCCMVIDEILGQQQVVIKSLGETIGKIRGVSGGAILGDGTVSLIIDVPSLIDLAQSTIA